MCPSTYSANGHGKHTLRTDSGKFSETWICSQEGIYWNHMDIERKPVWVRKINSVFIYELNQDDWKNILMRYLDIQVEFKEEQSKMEIHLKVMNL